MGEFGGERRLGRVAGVVFFGYKAVVSPVVHFVSASQCVFRPTCSEYAYVALARFGAARGGWLALRRVLRCHPWAKGGLDLVPNRPGEEPQAPAERLP